MQHAHSMDTEPRVDWLARLRQLVDGGCNLRIERVEQSSFLESPLHRWIELRRWATGEYAVLAHRRRGTPLPPELVTPDFEVAYAEFREIADEMYADAYE